ncbi:LamB/YcsF family protein [bacterium]|nr:LamB/YcsF family protein [bacterium]
MMTVNCDIGERGADNRIDLQLMDFIQIANIACGGHAGDENSIAVFRSLAESKNVEVAGHLSYPDRENFGRISLKLSETRLIQALDEQYQHIADIKMVKFHGALYNDSCVDKQLAAVLTNWLVQKGINRVITGFDSELAKACVSHPIRIIREAFAERRYVYSRESGRLSLVKRDRPEACIVKCDEALKQSLSIVKDQAVMAFVESGTEGVRRESIPIKADTICIHSDSVISLELARRLSKQLLS